jgi:hypothetical protein
MSSKAPAPNTRQSEQGAKHQDSTNITRHQAKKLQPRDIRLLAALERHPVTRHAATVITGAPNSPEYIRRLRALGLQIVCERTEMVDRDGKRCRPGRYRLLACSKRQARDLLAAATAGAGGK